MVLRGVNIFPIQIEKILMQFKELASNYLITLTTDDNNDNMTVEVELEELFTDDYQRLESLKKSVTRALKDEILLTPIVKLVPKGSLPVSEGKAVRVVDKRTVYQ
jgi:phenylacetate-CoA ligase